MLSISGPLTAEAYLEIGNDHLARDDYEHAIEAYRRILAIDPGSAEAWYNCAVAFHQKGCLMEAVDCYRRAIEQAPGLAEAHFNLAHALSDLNHYNSSEAAYKETLRLQPGNATAAYNLGHLYKTAGRGPEALTAYQQALQIRPDYAEALNNIGVIWKDQEKLDQARICFEQSLALKPDLVEALYNLGTVLHKQGDYLQAREMFRQALDLNSSYAPARWLFLLGLPMIYAQAEDIPICRRRFSANLLKLVHATPLNTQREKRNALEGIASTTNFYLQCQGENDIELQKTYGEFAAKVMAANYPRWGSGKNLIPTFKSGERIRIGYISSCMNAHTVGIFLLGCLQGSNRGKFEIFCYHVDDRTDNITSAIRDGADHFNHLHGNIADMAAKIESDVLHILVHTDIGMNPLTLQLAALRLAPVQCKTWGHPVTTGLPSY